MLVPGVEPGVGSALAHNSHHHHRHSYFDDPEPLDEPELLPPDDESESSSVLAVGAIVPELLVLLWMLPPYMAENNADNRHIFCYVVIYCLRCVILLIHPCEPELIYVSPP